MKSLALATLFLLASHAQASVTEVMPTDAQPVHVELRSDTRSKITIDTEACHIQTGDVGTSVWKAITIDEYQVGMKITQVLAIEFQSAPNCTLFFGRSKYADENVEPRFVLLGKMSRTDSGVQVSYSEIGSSVKEQAASLAKSISTDIPTPVLPLVLTTGL